MPDSSPRSHSLFLPAFILALGLAAGAFVLAGPLRAYVKSRHVIAVKGYAEQHVESDFAVWSADITARGVQINEAAAKMDKATQVVTDFLVAQGVPSSSIKFSDPTTTELNAANTNGSINAAVVVGYKIDRHVEVDTTDLDSMAKLANAGPNLLRSGMEINVSSVQYYCTKLADIKVTLLGTAVDDARRRAEQIARISTHGVGSLHSATQGVFQVTSPYQSETSDEGSFDLTSREKCVKAVVTADFELK